MKKVLKERKSKNNSKKTIPRTKYSTPEERKEAARWKRIFRVYGITREQYEELDHGGCPICLRAWSDTVVPVVDHDHVERLVRGLVCRYCNHRRIGHHRDASLVYRIAKYLEGPFSLKMPSKKRKKVRRKKV